MLKNCSRFYSAVAKSNKQLLDEFYQYHTTRMNLRPLIYRPKNATLLRSMDLKDPETNKPIQPREPMKPLKKQVLNNYVQEIPQGSKELMDFLQKWFKVSNRKRELFAFLEGSHLQVMLAASLFRIGHYSHVLGLLHSYQSKVVGTGNTKAYDQDRFFNTVLMCSLLRNDLKDLKDAEIGLKKLKVNWGKVTEKNDTLGLTQPLLEAYANQQGISKEDLVLKGRETISNINLPSIGDESRFSRLVTFITENKYTYFLARTIQKFSESCPNEIETFINEYKNALTTLKKDDEYDWSVQNMIEVNKIPEETKQETETQEETQEQ
ncbi:related to 37S ribosomal protein MRP13, mitochondrial [Nakaseomyces glabratus]|nr:hypothetical protein J6894_03362 [Nakaseomyces glabratus]QNG15434.1 uncharacterized protein GWK60_K00869 [Nakaseomyces glabratus]SCV13784.1 related to 37S ribosomal protein MRP13, mitochondrial [Nakaseomyces glabratus]SLM12086.1 related to 37S ribosomal protein MRP13, mitochondrial [Nakaseomyces glabratus]